MVLVKEGPLWRRPRAKTNICSPRFAPGRCKGESLYITTKKKKKDDYSSHLITFSIAPAMQKKTKKPPKKKIDAAILPHHLSRDFGGFESCHGFPIFKTPFSARVVFDFFNPFFHFFLLLSFILT